MDSDGYCTTLVNLTQWFCTYMTHSLLVIWRGEIVCVVITLLIPSTRQSCFITIRMHVFCHEFVVLSGLRMSSMFDLG